MFSKINFLLINIFILFGLIQLNESSTIIQEIVISTFFKMLVPEQKNEQSFLNTFEKLLGVEHTYDKVIKQEILCDLFAPQLLLPRRYRNETNGFDTWIEVINNLCVQDNEFTEENGCDMENDYKVKNDALRVKSYRNGTYNYTCKVPCEEAKAGDMIAMMKVEPNIFYLLAGFLYHRFFAFLYAPDSEFPLPSKDNKNLFYYNETDDSPFKNIKYKMIGVHPIFKSSLIKDKEDENINLFETFGIQNNYDRFVTQVKKFPGTKNSFYLLEGIGLNISWAEGFPMNLLTRRHYKASLGEGEVLQCGPEFARSVTQGAANLVCYNNTAEINSCCLNITACYDRCESKQRCDDQFCDCLDKFPKENVACFIGQQGFCETARLPVAYVPYLASGTKCVTQTLFDAAEYGIKQIAGFSEVQDLYKGTMKAVKLGTSFLTSVFGGK